MKTLVTRIDSSVGTTPIKKQVREEGGEKKFKEEMKDAVKSAKHSLPTHKVASDVPESIIMSKNRKAWKQTSGLCEHVFCWEKRNWSQEKGAARRKRYRDQKYCSNKKRQTCREKKRRIKYG